MTITVIFGENQRQQFEIDDWTLSANGLRLTKGGHLIAWFAAPVAFWVERK